MADNVFCSKCGIQNQSSSQVCQKCGAALWPRDAAPQPLQPAPLPHAAQPSYGQPMAYAPSSSSPYGGFWIRFLAHLIDHIVLNVAAAPFVFLAVLPVLGRFIHEHRDHALTPEMVFSLLATMSVALCVGVGGQWLYEALLTSSSWQGTVGKRLLRLKVTDDAGNRIGFGRATGRFFAKILSVLTLCIGFIMAGFTDRKRALHDMVAGTLVMKY